MSRIGEDGRTCGSCRYWYALAFECRCGPPQLVTSAEPGGRDRAAFPPRDPGDVACGEWTAPRVEQQAGEDAAILRGVAAGLRETREQTRAGGRR